MKGQLERLYGLKKCVLSSLTIPGMGSLSVVQHRVDSAIVLNRGACICPNFLLIFVSSAFVRMDFCKFCICPNGLL